MPHLKSPEVKAEHRVAALQDRARYLRDVVIPKATSTDSRWLSPLAFVAVVMVANATTSTLGLVHWFGIAVTAGTWFAGFGFVARDAVHKALGSPWVIACILIGAVISAAFSPALAIASATAFLLSELADFAVYQPLRRRGLLLAALASNLAGSIVDSWVFLAISGFPLSLIWAQIGIKYAATTIFVLIVWGARAVLRQPVKSQGGHRHD